MNLDCQLFPPSLKCLCKGGGSYETTLSVGCMGCWLSRCRQLLGIPGAAVWEYSTVSSMAPQPGKQLPHTALLTGWVGSMSGLVDSLRHRQYKCDPGSGGWLRGRVSNREDSSLIIYVVWRKDILGSRWQAAKVQRWARLHALRAWLLGKSWQRAAFQPLGAIWTRERVTEVYLSLRCPREACLQLQQSSRINTCRVRETSRAGAGVQVAREGQAGTNMPLQAWCLEQPQVPSPEELTRATLGFAAAYLLLGMAVLQDEGKQFGAETKLHCSQESGKLIPTPRASFEQVLAHQDLHRFQLSRSSLGLLLPTACSLWYVPSPRMLSNACFSYIFIYHEKQLIKLCDFWIVAEKGPVVILPEEECK